MRQLLASIKNKLPAIDPSIMSDVVLIVAIFGISLLIWLPTRYLPFHWDGAGFFNNAVEFLLQNDFQPFIATNSDFAHPPIFVGIFAAIFSLTGRSLLVSHLIMIPFLPMIAIATYYIGKKLSGRLVASAAALSTLLTPIIMAEYGVIYIDLPAAAFLMAAWALWLYEYRLAAVAVFTLAAMTKMTVLLGLPLFVLPALLSKDKSRRKRIRLFLVPSFILSIWLLYHYQATGWLLTRPGRNLPTPSTITDLISSFAFVGQKVLLSQGKWLVTLSAAAAAASLLISGQFKKLTLSARQLSVLMTIFIGIVVFSLSGEFALRYGIFMYPLVYMLSFHLVHLTLADRFPHIAQIAFLLFAVTAIIPLLISWHPVGEYTSEYEFRPPADLGYRDIIQINREAALFLQIFHPQARIYGAFPENIYVTQPHHGYVDRPLNLNLCGEFTYRPDTTQILYLHAYSPQQLRCRQILDAVDVAPLRRFESNDKWLELYEVASPAAQLEESPLDMNGVVK